VFLENDKTDMRQFFFQVSYHKWHHLYYRWMSKGTNISLWALPTFLVRMWWICQY